MNLPKDDIRIGLLAYLIKDIALPNHHIKFDVESFVVEEQLAGDIVKHISSRPLSKGSYTLIKVYKPWGVDTLSLLKNTSRKLKIKHLALRPLGLKDSRAIATQHILVKQAISDRKLKNYNMKLIGYIGFEHLSLIYHINKFSIKVYVKDDPSLLYEYLNQCSIVIPNFYGYQRFGSFRMNNHLIGYYIIKRRFKDAIISLLIDSDKYEPKNLSEWREDLANNLNFNSALKEIPHGLMEERIVLNHLVSHPGDYIGAIRKLPIRIRRFYLEAFQSFIFNLFLSKRIMLDLPIISSVAGDYIYMRNMITRSDGKTNISPLIPLVGYGYKQSKGPQGRLEAQILNALEIKPREFYIKELPEISLKGGFRYASQKIYHLSMTFSKDNTNIIIFNVVLDKGCYATMLLRELLKPRDPRGQGY